VARCGVRDNRLRGRNIAATGPVLLSMTIPCVARCGRATPRGAAVVGGLLSLLSLSLLAFVPAPADAAEHSPRTTPGPVVVELFTSQGCNSCPPADALLGELVKREDVLPLAFHVTYWDELGWRDHFAFAAADQRQYAYASAFGRSSVYTPQFVINGERDLPGATRGRVETALQKAARPARIPITQAPDGVRHAALPALSAACDCTLWQLTVRESARTPVGRGENAGRTLTEWHIVESMTRLGAWDGRESERRLGAAGRPGEISVVLAQRAQDLHVVAAGMLRR
jgi:hypothetical protein